MIGIISQGPMEYKETICNTCTYKLEYTNVDVKNRMGEKETIYHIDCPQCGHEIRVEAW